METKVEKMDDLALRFDSSNEAWSCILERRDSILRELKYSRVLGEKIDDEFGLYRRSFQAFEEGINYIFGYTESIKTSIAESGMVFVDNIRKYEDLEQIFCELASLLHNLLLSLMQRRETRFRFTRFSHSEYPRLPLFEVHIPYPITIRALEALCCEFRLKLEGYYNKFGGCDSSVVILQGGDDTACNITKTAKLIKSPLLGPKRENIRHILNLMFFTMPRYTASQIRYSSLLAHEEMHRLLWILDASEDDVRHIDGLPEPAKKAALVDYYDTYGLDIHDLTTKRIVLVDELIKFLENAGWPASSDEGDPPRRDTSEYRRELAREHIAEYCADIGAILLCGPAFVIANFISTPEETAETMKYTTRRPKNFIDDGEFFPSHPPSILRIHVQLQMLRKMGFRDLAGALCKEFESYLSKTMEVDGMTKYLDFVNNMIETGFLDFANELAGTIHGSSRASYDMRSDPDGEAGWMNRLRGIYSTIRCGNIYQDVMKAYLPSELLNAIWFRRVSENTRRDAPQRLIWRMAIENTMSNEFFRRE